MIFLNGEWQSVTNMEDALQLIKEQMGSEFEEKVRELSKEYAEKYARRKVHKI